MSLLRALWKRRLLAGAVWLAGTAVAFTVVRLLPAIYKAETVILVESRRARGQAADGYREAEPQDQLRTLRQQVLSYARLLALVREFGLYREEWQRRAEGDMVEMARRDIEIAMDSRWGRDRPGSFHVAFEGRDPIVAAAVANRLAGLFVEENSRAGDLEVVGASEFLQNQVWEARRRLQDQEARLGEFKTKYAGQLPQQESALLADLGRLQLQLQGVQDNINRTQQNKMLAETMLAAAQQAESSAETAARSRPASGDTFDETARKEAERLQKQLDTLRQRYTDEHPEIRHTRQLLAKVWGLRQQGAPAAQTEAAAEGTSDAASRPLARERERVESLKVQRDLAASQLQALEGERKRVLEQIGSAQAGISKLPAREQELIALNRDYELARANYQFLLDKNLATRVTTEMEKLQKPDSFKILEPARVPQRPLRPNRNLLNSLGAALALVLGVGVGVGTELKRGVLLGEWELPKEVVVLARVPRI